MRIVIDVWQMGQWTRHQWLEARGPENLIASMTLQFMTWIQLKLGGSRWKGRRMDGGGSFGQNEVPSPEGGGRVTGIQISFLYIFQIVVYHIQIIKMVANLF